MNKQVEVSIIVSTYNGENKIAKLLDTLLDQIFKRFELIIVVDGSTDNTLQVLKPYQEKFENIKIEYQQNQGRAKVRNNGAHLASGDILIFFDDDMRFEKNAVHKHFQHHVNSMYVDSILVGAQIEDYDAIFSDIQKYKASISRKWEGGSEKRLQIRPHITAANFSIATSLFMELGGFDERLTDAEDFDLAVRAFRQKIRIYHDSNIVGWHDDFITCKSYIKRRIEYHNARENLLELKPETFGSKRNTSFKRTLRSVFFFPFSFKFWPEMIDDDFFLILPKSLRFSLYSAVITSQSYYFPKKDN